MGSSPAESTPSRSKHLVCHSWQCYVLSGVKGREGGPLEGEGSGRWTLGECWVMGTRIVVCGRVMYSVKRRVQKGVGLWAHH